MDKEEFRQKVYEAYFNPTGDLNEKPLPTDPTQSYFDDLLEESTRQWSDDECQEATYFLSKDSQMTPEEIYYRIKDENLAELVPIDQEELDKAIYKTEDNKRALKAIQNNGFYLGNGNTVYLMHNFEDNKYCFKWDVGIACVDGNFMRNINDRVKEIVDNFTIKDLFGDEIDPEKIEIYTDVKVALQSLSKDLNKVTQAINYGNVETYKQYLETYKQDRADAVIEKDMDKLKEANSHIKHWETAISVTLNLLNLQDSDENIDGKLYTSTDVSESIDRVLENEKLKRENLTRLVVPMTDEELDSYLMGNLSSDDAIANYQALKELGKSPSEIIESIQNSIDSWNQGLGLFEEKTASIQDIEDNLSDEPFYVAHIVDVDEIDLTEKAEDIKYNMEREETEEEKKNSISFTITNSDNQKIYKTLEDALKGYRDTPEPKSINMNIADNIIQLDNSDNSSKNKFTIMITQNRKTTELATYTSLSDALNAYDNLNAKTAYKTIVMKTPIGKMYSIATNKKESLLKANGRLIENKNKIDKETNTRKEKTPIEVRV